MISTCQVSYAQRINKIGSRCSLTSLFYSQILANNLGDLTYTPCAGRASIFNGIVDFSGATVVLTGKANTDAYFDASGFLTGAALTNGQLLMGSSGTTPTANTITAGTGVSITNGAGTITIATTGANPNSTFLTTDYTNATATFSNTALSMTLTAAKTYSFACQIFASNSTAADGVKIDLAGGAATATTFIAGSNTTLITGTTSTLAGTFSNATLTGTNLISINGTIIVNAGGTFILRGAEVAHTLGTVTFLTGSRCSASLLN